MRKCARCHKVFEPEESSYKYCPSCYRLRKLGVVLAPVDKLDPKQFEIELYYIFSSDGYTATLTPSTGDHGADLILEKGNRRIAVQAKRYHPKNTVSNKAVQEVLAAMKWYECTDGWVITNSFFSTQAQVEAERFGIALTDREALKDLMPEMFVKRDKTRVKERREGNPILIIIRCANCEARNSVIVDKINLAVCGKCGAKLYA